MSILHTRINIGLSLLTLVGTFALIYLAFFDRVIPMERHRLIALEGIGIGPTAQFIITRELCFSRASEAEAHRAFRQIDPEGEVPETIHEQPPMLIHFDAGCNIRSRRTPLPTEIKPGEYRYMASLRWCNDIGRCQTAYLPDILVTILGDREHRVIRARPTE